MMLYACGSASCQVHFFCFYIIKKKDRLEYPNLFVVYHRIKQRAKERRGLTRMPQTKEREILQTFLLGSRLYDTISFDDFEVRVRKS